MDLADSIHQARGIHDTDHNRKRASNEELQVNNYKIKPHQLIK